MCIVNSERKILKGHEEEGCEIAGNIQEVILSQGLQRCLLRLDCSILIRLHVHSFDSGNILESCSRAELLNFESKQTADKGFCYSLSKNDKNIKFDCEKSSP